MNPLRDRVVKIVQRMRSRLTMRSMISNDEWTNIADELEHVAAQPAPPPLAPLPPGWSFQRGEEGTVHVIGPSGLTVARRGSDRVAEALLFELVDALLQDQDRMPITGPMTEAQVIEWMAGCSEPIARETLRHYLELAARQRQQAA